MSNSEVQIPSSPGSYLLVLYLRRCTEIQIGRLGAFSFRRGWYFYAGSAFGPGGLQARLGHHLKPLQRFHWHIDYLRSVAELRSLCYQTGVNNEHLWSSALMTILPEAKFPVAGFGSSDCRCASHLVYLPKGLGQRKLRSLLGGSSVKSISLLADG